MAGEKLLTETSCKAAKPKPKTYYLNDGGGLRLRCRPNVGRTWVFRYRLNSKENNVGLGPYPQVTLKVARSRADETRKQLVSGKNPSLEKKATKARRAVSETQTFGVIAREWIEHNKDTWSETHLKRNEGLVRRHLLPDLDRLPMSKRTKKQCRSPAMRGKRVCDIHGGKSTGPVTQAGRKRCASAKTVHGRETRDIRRKRSHGLARLREIEWELFEKGLMSGKRTPGPKPKALR